MLHSLKPEHFVIPPTFKHFASAQNAKAISATETVAYYRVTGTGEIGSGLACFCSTCLLGWEHPTMMGLVQ
jgi:hypothetical protein